MNINIEAIMHSPTRPRPRTSLARTSSLRQPFPRERCPLMLALLAVLVPLFIGAAHAQEAWFLSEREAPAAVFPDADAFERRVIAVTDATRAQLRAALAPGEPSIWEDAYVTFVASQHGRLLGYAVIVEEIGKHRPITFVVGIRPDGTVNDVAVMAYREAYGGEIRQKRFLAQYHDKQPAMGLRTPGDIKNIAGATLSVDAANRAVRKATAVAALEVPAGGAP
jgi:Na+-translocating ferredoxin:NAD+ oxidoreductase RnfG subunit